MPFFGNRQPLPLDEQVRRRQMAAQMLFDVGRNGQQNWGSALATVIGGVMGRKAMDAQAQLDSQREQEATALNSAIAEMLSTGDVKGAALQMARSRDPEFQRQGLGFLFQNAQPSLPEISDKMLENFTPESLAEFRRSGDFSRLSRIPDTIDEVEQARIEKYRAEAERARRPDAAPAPSRTLSFEQYLNLPPDQRALYDQFKGRTGDAAQSPEDIRNDALAREQARLTAKRQAEAPIKLASIDSASSALDTMQSLTDKGVGGPVAGRLVPYWAGGAGADLRQYDAQARVLIDELTRLQRIPGLGAQSNLELEEAMKAVPTSDVDEETRKVRIDQIRKKLSAMRAIFENPNVGGPSSQAPAATGATGDPLIDKYLY